MLRSNIMVEENTSFIGLIVHFWNTLASKNGSALMSASTASTD